MTVPLHPQKLRRRFQRVTPFKPGWDGSTWILIFFQYYCIATFAKVKHLWNKLPSTLPKFSMTMKFQKSKSQYVSICAFPEFRDWFSVFMSDCSLGRSRFNQQMLTITKVSYVVIQPNHSLASMSTNIEPPYSANGTRVTACIATRNLGQWKHVFNQGFWAVPGILLFEMICMCLHILKDLWIPLHITYIYMVQIILIHSLHHLTWLAY